MYVGCCWEGEEAAPQGQRGASRQDYFGWTKKRQQIQRRPKAHAGLPSALSAPKRVPAAGEQRLALCEPLRQSGDEHMLAICEEWGCMGGAEQSRISATPSDFLTKTKGL